MPSRFAIGRVDLEGLLGHLPLLFLVQELEGLEVVDPVGQLDEDDAQVVGHGQDDLPDGLGPPGLGRGLLDAADLRHPLDEGDDLLAEGLADLGGGHVRVLEDVVEEAGDERRPVEVHVGQHPGDLEGVAQVRLAGPADLPLVGAGGEDVGLLEDGDVLLAEPGRDLFQDVVEPDHRRSVSSARSLSRARIQSAAAPRSGATWAGVDPLAAEGVAGGLPVARQDEDGTGAGVHPETDILDLVADHVRVLEIEIEGFPGLQGHAGKGLAAGAVEVVYGRRGPDEMGAVIDRVDPGAGGGEVLDHPVVDDAELVLREESPADPGLVGDDDDGQAGGVELPDGVEAVGINADLVVLSRVADVLVDGPVPVQEDGPALHRSLLPASKASSGPIPAIQRWS